MNRTIATTAAPAGPEADLAAKVASAGLTLRALATWPSTGDEQPPAIAGFVVSSFSPLVAAVAERCLHQALPDRPMPAGRGERTAIVLVSRLGDVASAVHVADAVDNGARVGPLLFFQSVPNAVAGHLAARWGLAGPVVCISPAGAGLDEGIDTAALIIGDGDADEALLILAAQATADGDADRAVAALVGVPGAQEIASEGERS